MAIPKRIVRGVENIRTQSGSVDPSYRPYKAYLRIACLEMERARRGKEKESAMHQVRIIDARSREIDTEKDQLLQELGGRGSDTHPLEPTEEEAGFSPCPGRGVFKIRY